MSCVGRCCIPAVMIICWCIWIIIDWRSMLKGSRGECLDLRQQDNVKNKCLPLTRRRGHEHIQHKHPCRRRDLNPQSQQSSCRRPPPQTARRKKSSATPLGIDLETLRLIAQCLNNYAKIRTRNPVKRSVADPRLRPLGQWDRYTIYHLKIETKRLPRNNALWKTWNVGQYTKCRWIRSFAPPSEIFELIKKNLLRFYCCLAMPPVDLLEVKEMH